MDINIYRHNLFIIIEIKLLINRKFSAYKFNLTIRRQCLI